MLLSPLNPTTSRKGLLQHLQAWHKSVHRAFDAAKQTAKEAKERAAKSVVKPMKLELSSENLKQLKLFEPG